MLATTAAEDRAAAVPAVPAVPVAPASRLAGRFAVLAPLADRSVAVFWACRTTCLFGALRISLSGLVGLAFRKIPKAT